MEEEDIIKSLIQFTNKKIEHINSTIIEDVNISLKPVDEESVIESLNNLNSGNPDLFPKNLDLKDEEKITLAILNADAKKLNNLTDAEKEKVYKGFNK